MINVKKTLLVGTALVAVGGFALTVGGAQSFAAGLAIADTTEADGADGDNLTTTADGKYVNLDLNNTDPTVGAGVADGTNIDHNSTIYIYDSNADATANTITFTANTDSFDVADGKTLTIVIGSKNDGTQTTNDVAVVINKVVNTNTSGVVNISTVDNAAGQAIVFTGDNDVDLGTGTITLTNANDTVVFGTASGTDPDPSGALTANIAAVTAGDGKVTVLGDGDAAAAVSFTGNIGSSSLSIGTLTIVNDADDDGGDGAAGDDVFTFTGNVFAQTLALEENDNGASNGATVVIDSTGTTGAKIGDITTELNGDGNLTLKTSSASGSTFTISGGIGEATNDALRNIVLDDQAAGKVVTLVLSGNETHYFADLAANDAGDATLSITGDAVFAGNAGGIKVGNAAALGELTIAAGKSLAIGTGADAGGAGVLKANAISLGSSSTLTIANTNAGGNTITGDIDGYGTLDVASNTSVVGSVGDGTALKAVSIDEGKTLTVSGAAGNRTLAAGTILLEDAASDGSDAGLTLTPGANTITVENAVTVGVSGEGLITISNGTGTVAFEGDLGTSSKTIGNLTLGGGSNNLVTTTDDLYVDVIALDDSDVLQFLGTSDQTVSGVIRGVGANAGVIRIGDGTTTTSVTFDGLLGGGGNDPGALDVKAKAEAIFSAGGVHEIDGAVTNAGTIMVEAGDTLSTAGAIDDASAGTFGIGVKKLAGTQTYGKYAEADASSIANDTLYFEVSSNSQPLTVGASVLDDVFAGNAGSTIAGATITDNSYLYSFTPVIQGNNIDVTVAIANPIATTAESSANASVGAELMTDLAASTNAQINLVQGALQSASTAEEVNDVLEASVPDLGAGNVVATTNVVNTSADLAQTRLASLRDGSATGMAAGNGGEGLGVWAQGFGTAGSQDRRDGIAGYNVDTWGVAVGLDSENIAANTTLGISLAYASTNVDSDNATNTQTDIDTYQISLYGEYDLDDSTWLTGQVAYASGDNETSRTNVGGVAGLNARGNFDSNTWSARAELGRDYAMDSGMVLAPSVLANYMFYDPDDYTETGAGGASLVVDQDTLSIFELGLGVNASWMFQQADGAYVKPELKAGYRYDLVGDKYATTDRFTGGGGSFKTEGFDPARSTFDVGAGITYYAVDNWELKASYDYEFKSDYDSHNGYVRATYKF